jgi:hypothetical protein
MASAARKVGVDVSVPIDPAALSANFYQPDGMHLNHEGAVLFTAALAKDLPERVAILNAMATRVQPGAEVPFSAQSIDRQRTVRIRALTFYDASAHIPDHER